MDATVAISDENSDKDNKVVYSQENITKNNMITTPSILGVTFYFCHK